MVSFEIKRDELFLNLKKKKKKKKKNVLNTTICVENRMQTKFFSIKELDNFNYNRNPRKLLPIFYCVPKELVAFFRRINVFLSEFLNENVNI